MKWLYIALQTNSMDNSEISTKHQLLPKFSTGHCEAIVAARTNSRRDPLTLAISFMASMSETVQRSPEFTKSRPKQAHAWGLYVFHFAHYQNNPKASGQII